MLSRFLVVIVLQLIHCSAVAELKWQDPSVTFLSGKNYQVGDSNRTVMTLEHASGYSWMDNFFFFDRQWSQNNATSYFELSPRYTIASGEWGRFSGLKIATTWERGDSFSHLLYGLGTNIKVTGFDFIGLNLYRRNNDSTPNNYQMTLNWRRKIPIADMHWVYDGFIDWTSTTEKQASAFNFTSQLKLNIAPFLKLNKPFYLGIEYVFWNSKFGIDGIDERNVNLLIKKHF